MIYGERVRLRAIEREDLPLFTAWLNDPEVHAYLDLIFPFSLAEEERWFENMLSSPPAEHPLVIEVSEGTAWTPVGNCALGKIDWRNRSAAVGIFIGEKRYWNKGYGGDALRLLLRHGFETLNLNRVYLRVYETNLRGIRAYEKVGFVHEGRFREAEFRGGKALNVLYMSVLRSEWEARQAQ
ncbi:MAG: GNAT family protein [Anaerolineales bacterium]|nr:GNAT family protein [Anaerolineales bacterium]